MPSLRDRVLATLLFIAAAWPALLPAQTLVNGAEPVDATLVGARYRALGTTGNGAQRLFLGIPDLGTAGRRVETGGAYGAYTSPIGFRVELDRAGDRLLARINSGTDLVYPNLAAQLAALTSGTYGLDDLNVLRLTLQTTSTNNNSGRIDIADLRVNGLPAAGFAVTGNTSTGTASATTQVSVVEICLGAGNGFVVTGSLLRTGVLSNSAEGNRLEIGAAASSARGLRCTNPSDLAVADLTPPGPAGIGQTHTLNVRATNQGPGPTPSTRLRLTLPAVLGYVSADAPCSVTTPPVLECALGTLAAGAARTVAIEVSVSGSATPGIVAVPATVDSPIFDPAVADNSTDLQVTLADLTPPQVQSFTRLDPDPSAAASVRWQLQFSEAVTGVTIGDFVLAPGAGLSGAALTSVAGDGASWIVTAGTGGGSGALAIALVDDDSIVDGNGNPLGGPGAGNGDFTGETYAIDRTPPQVSELRGVGQLGNGGILPGEAVDAALTRLLVRFDKPMDPALAGDSARYALYRPGPDGVFQVLDCAPPPSDDEPLPLGPGSYLPPERSGVLPITEAPGLRPGAYRLIACASITDAVGNPLAAPYVQDFSVAIENRLPNPNFDLDLAGWRIATPGAGAGVTLVAQDAIGTAASQAAAVNAADGVGEYVLDQCLPLPALSAYGTGARARVAGNASVRVEARSHAAADCTGAVLDTRSANGPSGDTAGAFVRFDGVASGGLPGEAVSLELRYVLTLNALDASVVLDSAYFDRRAIFDGVFADGFE